MPKREPKRPWRMMLTGGHVIELTSHPEHRSAERIVVDGITDELSLVTTFPLGKWASVQSPHVVTILSNTPRRELEKDFIVLTLPLLSAQHEYLRYVKLEWRGYDYKVPTIEFPMSLDLPSWAKPWSALAFLDSIERFLAEAPQLQGSLQSSKERFDGRFSLSFPIAPELSTPAQAIDACLPAVVALLQDAASRLQEGVSRDSLVAYFRFPEEIDSAAQQYLLYFVQFLRDLGIDATAEIKQQVGDVLFNITPKSGEEALERVREALRIYLELPSAPQFIAATEGRQDMAVAQLRANVLHLQSQLTLAQATLQAKDAAIEALQIASFEYRQLILASSQAPSIKPVPDATREPLVGDVVSVTKYTGKGFEIDFPKILKTLKRRWLRRQR